MISLERKLLNKLLDSYENSALARGKNERMQHIYLHFNKKTIPAYFDENSMVFEQIHAIVKSLEERGFIQVIWRGGKEGHIIEKIMLCEDKITDVYTFLQRVPKVQQEELVKKLLEEMNKKHNKSVVSSFIQRLLARLGEGKSIKEYIDLYDLNDAKDLLNGIYEVEQNVQECFAREFSIRHFHDSKKFEKLLPRICRVFREECPELADLDALDIMAEYSIYHTPGFVYFKGNIRLKGTNGIIADISAFPQGIGLSVSHEMLENSYFIADLEKITEVYTIENLTSFFRFSKENALIVYLGGYHNRVRRELLKKIYTAFPTAAYFHFGDMDAGGFQIFDDLRKKTGIPFETYGMEVGTLEHYKKYGKSLTKNDRQRLETLLEQCEAESERAKTINYMLEHDVKLEQECIGGIAE